MTAYTILRTGTSTTPSNYTAKPIPWWNRMPINGTTTKAAK